jgi:acetyl esterase/lipase
LLNPAEHQEYIYPASQQLPRITDSAPAYDSDGNGVNPRMPLCWLYIQRADFLDYYSGAHQENSISRLLQKALERDGDANPEKRLLELVPKKYHELLPQLGVNSSWPPTFLVHGSDDDGVLVQDSHHMHDLLKRNGVSVRLEVVEGKGHSFDYDTGADEEHAKLFDAVAEFFREHLG